MKKESEHFSTIFKKIEFKQINKLETSNSLEFTVHLNFRKKSRKENANKNQFF